MNKGHNVRLVVLKDQNEAMAAMRRLGADAEGVKLMAPKSVLRTLMVEGLTPIAANILKQEMLSKGGEAAIHRGVVNNSVEKTEVLLMGTLKQYRYLCAKLKMQPFGLPKLSGEIKDVLSNLERYPGRDLSCRGKKLPLGQRTLVMGILNVTPDSFSDGGRFYYMDMALEQAHRMVSEGADIIDVGAESTRPTADPIPEEEEIRRMVPVLERLVAELDVPISVDTYKSSVAKKAMELGAHMLNDVWGLKMDPEIGRIAAEYQAPLILMHNQRGTQYRHLMGDIIASLRESIALAEDYGVPPENVLIDPGIGFGKHTGQNLEVMRQLGELRGLGKAILLGTSRKSMIGNTLNLPASERVEGTAATVALGIAQGADIVRVHDVKEMVRVARMTDAVVRSTLENLT
ncbi:MAG: dihydropteroate synthase [Bacillota bacterium]